jgi:hypothetical protein
MSVDEDRVAVERRLLEAEQLLYRLMEERGLSGDRLEAAFEAMLAAGKAAEREVDPYLSTVTGYVGYLGGELGLQAVFPDATVTLLSSARV